MCRYICLPLLVLACCDQCLTLGSSSRLYQTTNSDTPWYTVLSYAPPRQLRMWWHGIFSTARLQPCTRRTKRAIQRNSRAGQIIRETVYQFEWSTVLEGWRRRGSGILYRRTVSSFVHERGFANLLILCHSLPVQVRLTERFFDPSHGFQTRSIVLDMATGAVCIVAENLPNLHAYTRRTCQTPTSSLS